MQPLKYLIFQNEETGAVILLKEETEEQYKSFVQGFDKQFKGTRSECMGYLTVYWDENNIPQEERIWAHPQPKLVDTKLQVWHFAQVPCKPFCVDVKDEFEAKKIIDMLADQHLFLYENRIIPDYSNAITVLMWAENYDGCGNAGWTDYFNEKELMAWDEFASTYLEPETVNQNGKASISEN